jgi:hypothetical protein
LLAIPTGRQIKLWNRLTKRDWEVEGANLLQTQRVNDLALLSDGFDESLDQAIVVVTIKGLTAQIDEINQR